MNVQETYRRTMRAEGREDTELMDFDKSQEYTLSNDLIREVYEDNLEICKHKKLNIEQTLDSFVLALVDRGMPQDEAEEVCEIYDRTDGEYFVEGGNPPDEDDEDDDKDIPPEFIEPDEDDDDDYVDPDYPDGDYPDGDKEDDDEIIEV